MRTGVRLALDVGSVRVGVARSDPGGLLASPLTTVTLSTGTLSTGARSTGARSTGTRSTGTLSTGTRTTGARTTGSGTTGSGTTGSGTTGSGTTGSGTTGRRGRGPGPRGRDLDRLAEIVRDADAAEVIVGLPASLSGAEGKAAAAARSFAVALAGRIAPVPVRLVDERFTTVTAHDALRTAGRDSRARRGVVDQAAAAVLLQAALDAERASGRPPGELVPPARHEPRPAGAAE